MSKKCSFCYYIQIYHKNENNVALGLGKPQYHRLKLNVCKTMWKNNVKPIILNMPLSKLFVYIPYYNSQNLIFPITFTCTSKEKKIFVLNIEF